jgi:hypothetical protein
MIRWFLVFVILGAVAEAHEVQLITQAIKINRQNENAWQTDLIGKAVLSRKWEAGLQGTYLERFDFFEKRAGIFAFYKPHDDLTLELRYLKGQDTEILAHDQYNLNLYYSFLPGIAPYVLLRNSLYSVTHLQTMSLGVEIEKLTSWILIPQVTFGKARFDSPREARDVHNVGLKLIYYKESNFSLFGFAYKGKEAAQGVIGASNQTIDTSTGGFGGSYYVNADLKGELIFDYTDYEQIHNQFLTSTLNLVWAF